MKNLLLPVMLAVSASLLIAAPIHGMAAKPSSSMKQAPTERPDHEQLLKRLTPEQYRVTCMNGTEPPFRNAYWDNKEPGLYVDVISGKPLFLSTDKFDSGTGWPSFTRPVDDSEIVKIEDRSHGMVRVEVRSKTGDAHLGHVFPDGPRDQGGMRYCINSASLRFIPVKDLITAGYGEFLKHFED